MDRAEATGVGVSMAGHVAVLAALMRRDVDVAVLPDVPADPRLRRETVMTQEVVAIIHDGHPLARAREVTLQRFGRAVRLFAPLYVSNACLSSCTYCGFSKGLDVARRTLRARNLNCIRCWISPLLCRSASGKRRRLRSERARPLRR